MPDLMLSIPGSAARAYSFIEKRWEENCDIFLCATSQERSFATSHRAPAELFTTMVISELLWDLVDWRGLRAEIAHALVPRMTAQGTFCFFEDRELLPADIDCTSVGLTLLSEAGLLSFQDVQSALRLVLNNTDDRGIIEVYIEPGSDRRGIVDPVVCVNALYALALHGMDDQAEATRDFVFQVLQDSSYAEGTRYYPSRETLLCRLARLVYRFPEKYGSLCEPLREELAKCMGKTTYPLDMAQRIITARLLGVSARKERERLARLQNCDGSWPADGFFHYGRTKIFFGSQALTTAFALNALYKRCER